MTLVLFFSIFSLLSLISLVLAWWQLRRRVSDWQEFFATWRSHFLRGIEFGSLTLVYSLLFVLRQIGFWLLAVLHQLVFLGQTFFARLDRQLGRRRFGVGANNGSVSLFLAEVRQHRDRVVRERVS